MRRHRWSVKARRGELLLHSCGPPEHSSGASVMYLCRGSLTNTVIASSSGWSLLHALGPQADRRSLHSGGARNASQRIASGVGRGVGCRRELRDQVERFGLERDGWMSSARNARLPGDARIRPGQRGRQRRAAASGSDSRAIGQSLRGRCAMKRRRRAFVIQACTAREARRTVSCPHGPGHVQGHDLS